MNRQDEDGAGPNISSSNSTGSNAAPTDADITISVVIPVYNREAMIEDAVESVLTQNVPSGYRMEVIVVNDGSTDDTAAHVAAFATRDQRVHTRSIAHIGYPGAVRNRGVDIATGQIIAFLDSDDRWLPEKISEQIAVHTASGTDLSHTRERWVRDGRIVSQSRQRHTRVTGTFLPTHSTSALSGRQR